MKSPEFVIYAFPWDEESGGHMVLHALCGRLEDLGYSAAIWPSWKPVGFPSDWPALRLWLSYFIRARFLRRFRTGPFASDIAAKSDLKRAVVVYPELVVGNPLGSRKVVRWLLYPSGARGEVIDHGSRDLIVAYNEAFFDHSAPSKRERVLRVTYLLPEYRQWNFGERDGSAVIFRKGLNRCLDRHPRGAIPLDGLGHQEKAQVFNKVSLCYCYDLYTYFAQYAALCGCTPVIVPDPNKTEEEWQPDEAKRWGLAYGEARIPWAEQTRELLREAIQKNRQFEDDTVRQFVEAARAKQDW